MVSSATSPSFTPLFDSMPLDTWRVVGGAAKFELLPPPNGGAGPILVGRGPIPQNGFLVSPRVLGDFTLEVDVRIGSSDNPTGDKMNSGIQIRSQERASNAAKSTAPDTIGGLQIEIDPSPRAWSGGVYDERGRGWLAPLAGTRADGEPVDNAAGRAAFRLGEWNAYRIECDGPLVRTSINGVACAEWLDPAVSGLLCFQVHGGPACEVAFRAPRIAERGAWAWRAARETDGLGRGDGSQSMALPAMTRGVRFTAPAAGELRVEFAGPASESRAASTRVFAVESGKSVTLVWSSGALAVFHGGKVTTVRGVEAPRACAFVPAAAAAGEAGASSAAARIDPASVEVLAATARD